MDIPPPFPPPGFLAPAALDAADRQLADASAALEAALAAVGWAGRCCSVEADAIREAIELVEVARGIVAARQ